MSNIFLNLQSKLNLSYTLAYARIYHYIRFKFRHRIEKKDKLAATDYCKNIEAVINETEHFYTKVHPINVSLTERKDRNLLGDTSLTYGETSWQAAIEIMNEIEIIPKDIFYDLGCGSGKLVFLVNAKFGIKCTGVDFIENFIKISNIVCKKLNLQKINFINQDFLKKDLSDGTIFYITATCFEQELIDKLCHKLRKIKSGSKVIAITRPFNCEHLKLLKTKKCNFSWARDTVYFYERV
jgi:SAM-dependent methyltransferase